MCSRVLRAVHVGAARSSTRVFRVDSRVLGDTSVLVRVKCGFDDFAIEQEMGCRSSGGCRK